jgi:hypothetical protein
MRSGSRIADGGSNARRTDSGVVTLAQAGVQDSANRPEYRIPAIAAMTGQQKP